jgi:PAS domain S-box-containing protein
VLTLRDETARDAAERALRASEARLRGVFDQQFQFMAVLSPEGVTLEINGLPLRAAGLARDQVVGRPFWDTPFWAGLPAMREAWPGRLAEAARTDGPVLSEDQYQAAGGEVRTADAAVTAVRGPEGACGSSSSRRPTPPSGSAPRRRCGRAKRGSATWPTARRR